MKPDLAKNCKLPRTRHNPAKPGFRRRSQPSLGNPSRRPRRGFTLVELLTVITIIGILVALLVPGINLVREEARQTTCLNNGMELGRAMFTYDNTNGHLPGVLNKTQGGTKYNWIEALFPFLGRNDLWAQVAAGNLSKVQTLNVAITICPNDPYLVDPTSANYQGILSYGVNNTIFCDQSVQPAANQSGKPVVVATLSHLVTTPAGGGKFQTVPTSSTIMIGECTGDGVTTPRSAGAGPWSNMTWAGLTFQWPATAAPVSTYLASNHPGKVIAIFCDSHGEKVAK